MRTHTLSLPKDFVAGHHVVSHCKVVESHAKCVVVECDDAELKSLNNEARILESISDSKLDDKLRALVNSAIFALPSLKVYLASCH